MSSEQKMSGVRSLHSAADGCRQTAPAGVGSTDQGLDRSTYCGGKPIMSTILHHVDDDQVPDSWVWAAQHPLLEQSAITEQVTHEILTSAEEYGQPLFLAFAVRVAQSLQERGLLADA